MKEDEVRIIQHNWNVLDDLRYEKEAYDAWTQRYGRGGKYLYPNDSEESYLQFLKIKKRLKRRDFWINLFRKVTHL